jgi:hypothetical protein
MDDVGLSIALHVVVDLTTLALVYVSSTHFFLEELAD